MNRVATNQAKKHAVRVQRARNIGSRVSVRCLLTGAALLSLLGCAAAIGGADEEAPGVLAGELKVPIDEPVILAPILLPSPFPIPFPRPPKPNPEDFLDISAGTHHTCVRKRNGNVYCWGWDDRGQAGNQPNATCVSSPNQCIDRPRQISSAGGFTTATQLDSGIDHNCALDASGKAYCWGSAGYGQVGDGAYGDRPIAIPVSGGLPLLSVVHQPNYDTVVTANRQCAGSHGSQDVAEIVAFGEFTARVEDPTQAD